MIRFLRGWLELEFTGAAPERCLNRFAARDVAFWRVRQPDRYHGVCRIYAADLGAAERAAAGCQCSLRVTQRRGLPVLLRRLLRRPILLAGVPLAVLLALVLQNFVWVVRVEGNRLVPKEQILRALAEEEVCFGAWGPSVETQRVKNRMLNRVPELSWLAVNRTGAVATVLVTERAPEASETDRREVTDLAAVCPGVVTSVSVLNGFALVAPGDAVAEGEVLITGLAEWTTHVQATRALGEVYAQTMHRLELRFPAMGVVKRYTGRSWRQVRLILGRKRIILSGNSGILGTTCDKMISREPLILPGGWELPAALEIVTLREYVRESCPLRPAEAERIALAYARRVTADAMIAGTILEERTLTQQKNGSIGVRVDLTCEEMICRTVPVTLFGEEVTHGEADQRGTD